VNQIALTLTAAACLCCCASGHAETSRALALPSVDRATPKVAPERFVSSTLKFAMAELGRSSPGARWVNAAGAPAGLARRPFVHRPMSLVMSVAWPVTTGLFTQATQQDQAVVLASLQPAQNVPPLALAAWRMASIR
jgi:hypothetical protein